METPKEYYYTYYSYEEWGKGYFGSRGCKCLPKEDVKYFGSFSDKNFNPTQKIILNDDYTTRKEAYADEIILQEYYKVVENPHFANRAYQTSTKFYVPIEQAKENGKKAGNKNIETGHIIELGKKKAKSHKENKTGIFGLSTEQKSENGKKGGAIAFEMKVGVHARTKEQMSEDGKKGGSISGKNNYENGIGLVSITKEERKEIVSKTNSQKWMCLETGYITTSGPLTAYQRARCIDTSKRKRIE